MGIHLQVLEARNTILHAANMKLNEINYQLMTQSMVDLLEDPQVLAALPEAQNAVIRIKEVNTS